MKCGLISLSSVRCGAEEGHGVESSLASGDFCLRRNPYWIACSSERDLEDNLVAEMTAADNSRDRRGVAMRCWMFKQT